ncbi:MAG: chloride channel protein [Candidatus Acidiferrum sp.]
MKLTVFGGAARVPIATLLMVAEMTGGYQLLVPASLAVMLSFLIQTQLSSFFKYTSLYASPSALNPQTVTTGAS